jgi:hypothetical protein
MVVVSDVEAHPASIPAKKTAAQYENNLVPIKPRIHFLSFEDLKPKRPALMIHHQDRSFKYPTKGNSQ